MSTSRAGRSTAWTVIAVLWPCSTAHAVPSFARQTGLECVACHVSWPELTSVGRQFKLGAYTLTEPSKEPSKGEARPLLSFDKQGPPPVVPLAAFLQASVTHSARTNTGGTDAGTFPKQDELILQQASLFLAGRINEHAGGFAQWSYDGVEHHSAIDNVDLRVAHRYESERVKVLYGLSLNNSPTVSDIYNTTPVWGFPFASSSVAATPAASTLMQEGLAQQVIGLTAYSLWNRTLYAELGAYRTADKAFSVFRAGVDRSTAAVLDGAAPYWRLALQREWGDRTHSAMLGAQGLSARKFPDSTHPQGPTDRFRDVGVDAQYQYVTDTHRFSAQMNYIRERQTLDGSFASGAASNASNRLNSLTSKLTYYYKTKYGLSLAYLRIQGDSDANLYSTGEPVGGSANGRPDSSAYIAELNWLPSRDRRFTLQYTGYQKFNGARNNYDGFGRNARDNNSLLLLAWFAF
jgi:hypothetical protein